jgi:hypothetical protein
MGVMQAGGEPAAPQSDEARRIPVVNCFEERFLIAGMNRCIFPETQGPPP